MTYEKDMSLNELGELPYRPLVCCEEGCEARHCPDGDDVDNNPSILFVVVRDAYGYDVYRHGALVCRDHIGFHLELMGHDFFDCPGEFKVREARPGDWELANRWERSSGPRIVESVR